MRLYISLLIMLLTVSFALGAVGDREVSEGSSTVPAMQSYQAGIGERGIDPLEGYQPPQTESSMPYQALSGGYPQGDQQAPLAAYPSSESAPQIEGPYQERMSAEDLRLSEPLADSFQPDASLNFAPATPSGLPTESYGPGQGKGQASWYYPRSAASSNRFYVQTSSGLGTVAGCKYGGYLPLWSDINSGGNFYVYEWYPGQRTPSVKCSGWTWTGFKKGWFSGDVPGWHILCYNCGDWSNYIYIYVHGPGGAPGAYSAAAPQGSLPAGAPTPPDPNSEKLVLPDFNLYKPVSGQGGYPGQGSQSGYPAEEIGPASGGYPIKSGYPVQSGYPDQSNYFDQGGYPLQSGYPVQSSYPSKGFAGGTGLSSSAAQGCPTCVGGVSSSYPVQGGCPTCSASAGLTAPSGYAPQSYHAVYPRPSSCRCYEYYVQVLPGKISTTAGVKCKDWLPLWSKISRPGMYWSFEWALCGNPPASYCPPEVKNFRYKGPGWCQTWFRGNKPGWHVLSYYCNDWSNYVYIYVWPAS